MTHNFSVTHNENMPCAHTSVPLAFVSLFTMSPIFTLFITSLVSCPSGDRAVQTSGCGNLSVEPVCRPSALQCLLVCSVHRPAVLRRHVWQRLSRPSGNHVLPAHKVWRDYLDYTNPSFVDVCAWSYTRCVLLCNLLFSSCLLHLLNPTVSLNVVQHRTLFWVWPSWCPISLLDCSTYASSTWEVMQLFRMRTSCTGEMLSPVLYHHQLTLFGPLSTFNPVITRFLWPLGAQL